MQLVKEVHVEGFRSLRDATLKDLGSLSVLAGLNNSGKSNFLRALSLFFNNSVEPGVPFDFMRDYYRPELGVRKLQKEVSVSVRFSLPASFKFRQEQQDVANLLGREFTIAKVWDRYDQWPQFFLNEEGEPREGDDYNRILAFLDRISFRYVPNRVIPTDVIQREQQALRDVLIRRLARYKQQTAEIFSRIQITTEALSNDVSQEVTRVMPDVVKVQLATARSLADLVFKFGYRLSVGGAQLDDTEQGAGMQSFLMFLTLYLIDRDYSQRFGWKQAAIWAVEEPESSQNMALEAQVARFLSRITRAKTSRLQVISTTHSDLMVQYSDKCYYVEKREISTGRRTLGVTEAELCDQRDLLRKCARFGVSRWINPLLYYPLDALVLVEGKRDRTFIIECLRLLKLDHEYRVVCLEDVTGKPEKGGVDTIRDFTKSYADDIKTRYKSAPVVVVLDWEAKAKVSEFLRPFSADDPIKVMAWDETEANPKLHPSFRGIERFYSDRMLSVVEARDPSLISTKQDGTKCIMPEDAKRAKSILDTVLEQPLLLDDVEFAELFIRRLHAASGGKTP